MAAHNTPTFPIALRGLASLSALSGLLGEATDYSPPEAGKLGAEGDPMVSWTLESGLMVALSIAPHREHVVIANQPKHPLYRAVHNLCAKYEIEIDVLGDDDSPADRMRRMRKH